MLHLVRGERDCRDVWQQHGTYEAFLRDAALCDPAVYRKFERALALFGGRVVQQIGTFGAIEASRASDEHRATVVRALAAWTSEHSVPPSARTARSIVEKIDPRPHVPAALAAQEEIQQLRKRVRTLEAALAEAQTRIGQLEAEARR